jgi:hypothetical protein
MVRPQTQTKNTKTTRTTRNTKERPNTTEHTKPRKIQKQAPRIHQTREERLPHKKTRRNTKRPKTTSQNPQNNHPIQRSHTNITSNNHLRGKNDNRPAANRERTERPLHHDRTQNHEDNTNPTSKQPPSPPRSSCPNRA